MKIIEIRAHTSKTVSVGYCCLIFNKIVFVETIDDVETTPASHKMDMLMNMPGNDNSSNMNDMNMKHHMWMWFHTSIGDTVLFDFWTVNSVGGMILSCALVFLMGLCFEGIKFLRWRVEVSKALTPPTSMTMYATIEINSAPTSMRYVDKLRSSHHLIQTFLFGIQIVVSYLLMLVFMTFSIWLGLAVSLGTAVGYYLFGTRHDSDVCRPRNTNSQSTDAHSCCG